MSEPTLWPVTNGHVHVIPSIGIGASIETDHAAWLASTEPCILCGLRSPNFVVGHNMPGYLPESDPWIAADWESARNALLEDMDRHADSLGAMLEPADEETDELVELERAMDDLRKAPAGSEWGWTVGNTAYWLSFTDEVPDNE